MKSKFKIATFNLWKDCGKFPQRIENIAPYLTKLDCICLQEDYDSENFTSSDTINRELNLYKATLPLRKKKRNEELSSSNLTILSKYKMTILDEVYFNKNKDDERGCMIGTNGCL